MLEGILQRGNQALILGEVVGLVAEVLAERGNFLSSFILDHDPIAGRPGIAARAAIAVSDQMALGRFGVRRSK